MYIVYKHSFGQKNYIGFTSLSLEERLHKHELNALSGIDTKFYRAIRKYGLDKISSSVLCECSSKREAIEKEKIFIKKYNSYKNGYNMTEGGDGGDIISKLSNEKYKGYINKLKKASYGENNPRYIQISDDELVNKGIQLYLKNNLLTTRMWQKYAKENNLPMSFSKFRFNGKGMSEFKKRISDKLGIDINTKYKKTDSHKEKLSKSSSNYCWVNKNGEEKRIHKSDKNSYIQNGYNEGRIEIDVLNICGKIHNEYNKIDYKTWRKFMIDNDLTPINFPKNKYSLKEIKKIIINNGDNNN
jgi:hypothetical protein